MIKSKILFIFTDLFFLFNICICVYNDLHIYEYISSLDISDHLKSVLNKEGYKVEKEALKLIALKADGSLRDALSLADKVITLCDRDISYDITAKVLGVVPQELYLELLNKIVSKDLKSCLKAINKVMDSGISNSNFLEGFVGYLRDSICYIILYREDLNLSQESAAFLDSEKLDAEGLNRLLNLSLDRATYNFATTMQ